MVVGAPVEPGDDDDDDDDWSVKALALSKELTFERKLSRSIMESISRMGPVRKSGASELLAWGCSVVLGDLDGSCVVGAGVVEVVLVVVVGTGVVLVVVLVVVVGAGVVVVGAAVVVVVVVVVVVLEVVGARVVVLVRGASVVVVVEVDVEVVDGRRVEVMGARVVDRPDWLLAAISC